MQNTNIKEIKDAQALQTFIRIDDICHEQVEHMKKTGNPHNFTWLEEFMEIDSGFHNAVLLKDRLERAKKMMAFADKTNERMHQVWAIDTPEEKERDRKYHEISDIFNQLLQ